MKSREITAPGAEFPVVRLHPLKNQSFLERGFSLAYFIFPDRTIALRILTSALNKLKSRIRQESKRAYWRDKFLKGRITRITRDNEDTLQWLIYLESSAFEKAQEALRQSSTEDMVVRYVKALIQSAAWMSSFYVNLAIHRLLYCYTTPETQTIYEFVSDHYREADEYRRGKRLLMLRLESRFEGNIQIIKGEHGEARFRLAENQEKWNDTVLNCLQMFTPWSTQAKCPFRQDSALAPQRLREILAGNCEKSSDQDKIETHRSHVFIDPACSAYIVEQLGLEQHSAKLGVPLFHMNADRNIHPPSRRLPDNPLTSQEEQAVAGVLSAEQERRSRVTPTELRFIVGDIEYASLHLDEQHNFHFDVPLGPQLLELWTRDEHGPLLLATHRLAEGVQEGETDFKLPLGNNRSLSISVLRFSHETSGWRISVLVSNIRGRSVLSQIQTRLTGLSALPAYAGLIFLMMASLFIWSNLRRELRSELSKESELKAELAREKAYQPSQTLGMGSREYRLTPDDLITRGVSETRESPIAIFPPPVVINFALPVTQATGRCRAVLTSLEDDKAILSEEQLSPTVDGNDVIVVLPVPSSLLSPDKYYVITVQGSTSQYSRTFTFHMAPA